jgi:hypothetical protein
MHSHLAPCPLYCILGYCRSHLQRDTPTPEHGISTPPPITATPCITHPHLALLVPFNPAFTQLQPCTSIPRSDGTILYIPAVTPCIAESDPTPFYIRTAILALSQLHLTLAQPPRIATATRIYYNSTATIALPQPLLTSARPPLHCRIHPLHWNSHHCVAEGIPYISLTPALPYLPLTLEQPSLRCRRHPLPLA